MGLLLLQASYGLIDPELERQALDRISFQQFLEFPGDAPDQQHRLEIQGARSRDLNRHACVGGAAVADGREGFEGEEERGLGRRLHSRPRPRSG